MSVIVRSIRLRNFMPFVDETVPLDRGLTVIVGRNGAGKSAILHGLKFCLGSNQREKRFGSWEGFIRWGAEVAEVEVTVEHQGETIVFARRIGKKGVPLAYINGRRVRASELRREVERLGFKVDNPLVFLPQERVIQLSSASATDIREMVEDGTGLYRLRDRILLQETELRHDRMRLEAALLEARSIQGELKLLEGDLKRLKKKQDLQRTRESLEIELKWAELELVERNIERIDQEIQEEEVSLRQASAKVEEIENKIESETQTAKAIESQTQLIRTELGRLRERLDSERDRLKNLKESNKQAVIELGEIDKRIKRDRMEMMALQSDIEAKKKEIWNTTEELEELREKEQAAREEQERLEEALTRYVEWNTRRMDIRSRLTAARGRLKDREIDLRAYRQRLQTDRADLEEIERQWSDLWETLETTSEEELLSQRTETNNRIEELAQRRVAHLSRIAELKRELAFTEELIAERSKRIPKTVRALRSEVEKHGLEAIGPLVEVVGENEEMAGALEAVLRDQLAFAFITTDAADFQLLCRIRDELEAPAPVFLVEDSTDERAKGAPEIGGREGVLGDLWRMAGVTEELARLLRRSIGSFLVVSDAGDAMRIARTARVATVTPQGHVFIVGNGFVLSRPQSGQAGLLSTAPLRAKREVLRKQLIESEQQLAETVREIANLERLRDELTQLLERYAEKDRIWARRSELAEDIERTEEAIRKIEEEILPLREEIEELVSELRKMDSKQPPERSRIQGQLVAVRQQIAKLASDISARRGQVERARAILRADQDKVGTLEESIAALQQHRDELKEILRLAAEQSDEILENIEGLERRIEELSSKEESLSQELSEHQTKLYALNRELAEHNVRSQDLIREVRRKRLQLGNLETRRKEIQSQVASIARPARVRPLADVTRELESVTSRLDEYRDVDDDLLRVRSELAQRLAEVEAKADQIRDEMSEAESTLEDIKAQYYSEMAKVLERLGRDINTILRTVELEGEVRLEMVKQDEEYGVEFLTRIKDGTFKGVRPGSGGERTLITIALIIALQQLNPAPIYFLDEADMALDAVYADRVGRLFKAAAADKQIVILTPLRSVKLLKHADTLLGVATPDGRTPVIIEAPEEDKNEEQNERKEGDAKREGGDDDDGRQEE